MLLILLVVLYWEKAYLNTTISTVIQTHSSNDMCLCHVRPQLGSLLYKH